MLERTFGGTICVLQVFYLHEEVLRQQELKENLGSTPTLLGPDISNNPRETPNTVYITVF